jgi:hypothetical protein
MPSAHVLLRSCTRASWRGVTRSQGSQQESVIRAAVSRRGRSEEQALRYLPL